ncbi:MAG: EVE domain-containing protein [Melioribacteraceae bacterium]|nr:MAG: EVE domain-containing protein [Melioribacteraceae bacterium]
MPKYWMVKSEPDVYSIDDLKKEKTTHWDGVRNYQARNFMRDEMKVGDKVLYYHSNTDPVGVVGVCEVCKEGYPDFTAFDPDDKHYDPRSKEDKPTWIMVDVKFVEKFKRTVSLAEIKENDNLQNMKLVQRGNRLSVMPVTEEEYKEILKLSKK